MGQNRDMLYNLHCPEMTMCSDRMLRSSDQLLTCNLYPLYQFMYSLPMYFSVLLSRLVPCELPPDCGHQPQLALLV